METNNDAIDSMETSPEEAKELLTNLCENGFAGDAEELAIALGRDKEEIHDLLSGEEDVDEDLLMKVRGIAQEREIEID
jgi:hypothetical protein